MKLTIFAATGGIGRQLFEQAVAAGHEVTAVARHPENLPVHAANVSTVTADLSTPNLTVLTAAVKGADAVLSGLGPRNPRTEAGITSRGTEAIVEAMQLAGTRRLIVVSAAPIGTVPSPGNPRPPKHDPGDGFFMRNLGVPFARTMFGRHHADLAVMEDLVREWTRLDHLPPAAVEGQAAHRRLSHRGWEEHPRRDLRQSRGYRAPHAPDG
jgi:nucleoside-diphosphate-sugar epimerase